MSDRVGAFIGSMILAAALVSCVLVKLTPAAPRKITLDPKDAVTAIVLPTVGEQGQMLFWFNHECCACGSSHRVLLLPTEEGIRMFWWADKVATRKARTRKGTVERNPWAAESDPWNRPIR